MRVIKRYNQHRRDLSIDMECESCGHKEARGAYDDFNYWNYVLPRIECGNCGQSTNSLGNDKQKIQTKHPDGYVI